MKKRILVTDCKQRHSQVIIKALQEEHEIYSIVENKLKAYFFNVKYISKTEKDLDVKYIIEQCKKNRIEAIVPISIQDYSFFSQNKSEIINHGISILVSSYGIWSMLNDKNKTMEFANNIGVPIPKTVHLSKENFVNEINQKLSYKVVIKSINEGGAKFVKYANNDSEAKYIVDSFLKQKKNLFDEGIIAQEYIDGISCGYFCISKNGEIINEFAHMRMRENPPTGGVSTACKSYYHQKIFDYGRKIVQQSKYTGVCMVEFKYIESKDEFFLIEVNPKFWGSILLSIVSGINFPKLYMQVLNNEKIIKKKYNERKVQFVLSDLSRTVKYKTDFNKFIKDFFSTHTDKDIYYLGVWRFIKYYIGRKIYGQK